MKNGGDVQVGVVGLCEGVESRMSTRCKRSLASAEITIYRLFDYSLIGNSKPDSKKVTFKIWETQDEVIKLNRDYPLILHFGVKVYLVNKNY